MRGPHDPAQRLDAAAMAFARGKPRAAAQRPLPSMMIATCKGPVRSGPSVAGAAAFDIIEVPAPVRSLDLKSRYQISI